MKHHLTKRTTKTQPVEPKGQEYVLGTEVNTLPFPHVTGCTHVGGALGQATLTFTDTVVTGAGMELAGKGKWKLLDKRCLFNCGGGYTGVGISLSWLKWPVMPLS